MTLTTDLRVTTKYDYLIGRWIYYFRHFFVDDVIEKKNGYLIESNIEDRVYTPFEIENFELSGVAR